MEVHFTPEQEAQLSKIASQEGIGPQELVKDAALRLLEDDVRFRAGVRKGIEQADRGEFIEEKEMNARIKRMFPIIGLGKFSSAVPRRASSKKRLRGFGK
jgi:predicted transcriptional regulator